MKQANQPFQFVAASSLILITGDSASTLQDFGTCVKAVSDASIFCHTFNTLAMHHFTTYSNDFAQWTMAACNEQELSERLAAVDVRQFVAIEELRTALTGTIAEYLRLNPKSSDRVAFEPFYFCEAREVTLPLDYRASDLAELADGIRRLSLQSLHYHFINSRLRLHLRTNDFSHWVETELDLPELGAQIDHVDFYTTSLEGVREDILKCIQPWVNR